MLLTGYHGVAPGPLANGLALLTGRVPTPEIAAGCPVYAPLADGRGCVAPAPAGARAEDLPSQLTEAGRTWRAYVEGGDHDGPGCRHPVLGQPDPWTVPRPGDAALTARDPFVYLGSVTSSADCASAVTGLGALGRDLADPARTPSFSYLVPDACHDGRDAPCAPGAPAGLAAADAWLRFVLAPVLASKAYADGGLVVVTTDAAPASGPGADASGAPWLPPGQAGGGRVGALVLSPRAAAAGTTVDTTYDQLSLLRTLDRAFGLDPLGLAADRRVRPFGRDVLDTSASQDVHPGATGR